MEIHPRMPLHDLPLERFLTSGTITGNKTPRKHKRPLSPSRTTPLNPAKRRVLDAEGVLLSTNAIASPPSHPAPFMLSNMQTVTPSKALRLGNGLLRSYQPTSSPLSMYRDSPSRDFYPKPTLESSTDPQSRHYPGFDIFRDGCRGPPIPTMLSFESDVQVDRSDEDKENVPLRRKTKRQYPKKRLLTTLEGSGSSCPGPLAQKSKVVRPERTPFSARQALR